jgi:hypothetical protein
LRFAFAADGIELRRDTQLTTGLDEGGSMMDDTGTLATDDASLSRVSAIEQELSRHLDLTTAILLSIATVATAWCVYQATGFSGEQTRAYAEASSSRIESTRSYNRSMEVLAIDADLFVQWVAAYNAGDQRLLAFYESNLMRPAFLPHLNEWRASNPLTNPDAATNPLVSEEYQRQLFAESERLRAKAEVAFEEASEANQASDKYILATVSFASVLFFAGISPKFRAARIQLALVGMAIIMLVVGVVQIGGLPVH